MGGRKRVKIGVIKSENAGNMVEALWLSHEKVEASSQRCWVVVCHEEIIFELAVVLLKPLWLILLLLELLALGNIAKYEKNVGEYFWSRKTIAISMALERWCENLIQKDFMRRRYLEWCPALRSNCRHLVSINISNVGKMWYRSLRMLEIECRRTVPWCVSLWIVFLRTGYAVGWHVLMLF